MIENGRPRAEDHWDRVSDAFSRKSVEYEDFARDHPNQTRMRQRVYARLEALLRPGAKVLELNAGTGTDALYLAQRGYRVHATDIAPGMLEFIAQKAGSPGLEGRLTVQRCSFLDLTEVEGRPFDAVFSNFGGLNCLDDLGLVANQVTRLLKVGGTVTLVVMPPICPWELSALRLGEHRFALRRLRRGGVMAHVSGVHFRTHYHTPRAVARAFGPGYEMVGLEGLSIFAPPADHKDFPARHPRLYRTLVALDDRLASLPPFRGWGDFFILSLARVAQSPADQEVAARASRDKE